MNREERYNRERRVIENKMSFFIHLAVYVLVNGFVVVPYGGFIPALGWGIGLAVHFLKTFIFDENYVERAVERKLRD